MSANELNQIKWRLIFGKKAEKENINFPKNFQEEQLTSDQKNA